MTFIVTACVGARTPSAPLAGSRTSETRRHRRQAGAAREVVTLFARADIGRGDSLQRSGLATVTVTPGSVEAPERPLRALKLCPSSSGRPPIPPSSGWPPRPTRPSKLSTAAWKLLPKPPASGRWRADGPRHHDMVSCQTVRPERPARPPLRPADPEMAE